MLVGDLSVSESAARLGLDLRSRDAMRLAIYRRSYLHNVGENMASLFPITKSIVVQVAGEAAWRELVLEVAKDHPPPQIRFGTSALVTVLEGRAAWLGLPPWLHELADLELAERVVFMSPDEAGSAIDGDGAGGATLADALTLRVYAYDVLDVRCSTEPTRASPRSRRVAVAIWRTREGRRRTKRVSEREVAVLRALYRGGGEAVAALRRPDETGLTDAVSSLIREGVILDSRRDLATRHLRDSFGARPRGRSAATSGQ